MASDKDIGNRTASLFSNSSAESRLGSPHVSGGSGSLARSPERHRVEIARTRKSDKIGTEDSCDGQPSNANVWIGGCIKAFVLKVDAIVFAA